LKKVKISAVVVSVLLVVCIAFFLLYKFVLSVPVSDNSISEGMIPWSVSQTPGLYLMVPDDYTETSNTTGNVSDFVLYHKDDSRIKLTYEYSDNDLNNYSINAIDQYRNITDEFKITKEYNEKLSDSTEIHVTEFDYSLKTSNGMLSFSCLSGIIIGNGRAYVLTCTCNVGNYEKYRDDFVRTYKTMRVLSEDDVKKE